MSKLYDLTDKYLQLVAEIEEYDLDPAALLDTLEGSDEMTNIEDKVNGIVCMIKNFEADVPGLDAEIERLTARKKAIKNRVDSVKNYLQMNLEKAGIDSLKVGIFTVKLQKNPASLVVKNLDEIPARYITIIPEQHQPDKKAIKDALKAGEKVAGVELVQGRSLRIK